MIRQCQNHRTTNSSVQYSNDTSLSCLRQTRAMRCVTPIVLYTKVDAQCDKLVTDDRR